MSANPPSPSADRARVEAVRATLNRLAGEYEAFSGLLTRNQRDATQEVQTADQPQEPNPKGEGSAPTQEIAPCR